jgi:hypothetical protein
LPYIRIIPREDALPHNGEILPGEVVSYIIDYAAEDGLEVNARQRGKMELYKNRNAKK